MESENNIAAVHLYGNANNNICDGSVNALNLLSHLGNLDAFLEQV